MRVERQSRPKYRAGLPHRRPQFYGPRGPQHWTDPMWDFGAVDHDFDMACRSRDGVFQVTLAAAGVVTVVVAVIQRPTAIQ